VDDTLHTRWQHNVAFSGRIPFHCTGWQHNAALGGRIDCIQRTHADEADPGSLSGFICLTQTLLLQLVADGPLSKAGTDRQIEQGGFSNEITPVLQAIGAATADFLTLAKFREEIRSGPEDNR
jgi:hypothetical protein